MSAFARAGRLIVACLLLGGGALAQDDKPWALGGRIAYQFVATTYPEDSVYRDLTGSYSIDNNLIPRIMFGLDVGRWDFEAHYELIARYGDAVRVSRELPPELLALSGRLNTDERRLFDLTHILRDEGDFAALHRLDRLSVGITTDKTVVRFGRQAITWGNGMIYTPMDIFNPFDPAAVDKEFKTGDDMLYGQYLRDSGDDVQGVMVFRRDLATGDVASDKSSLAFKYHGMAGNGEFDALVAQHYGEPLVAAGGNRSIGGAVVRGDVTVTFTDDDDVVASLVTSGSYSWIWGGKNTSGVLEYFYNGFGQRAGEYDPASLADNPELLERIARGELFTLGRHYLAGAATVELSPLTLITPNVFVNLADPSALVQFVLQNDVRQNLVLLTALNIPIGADGTEFGGIPSGVPGGYLASGPGVFFQLNYYF